MDILSGDKFNKLASRLQKGDPKAGQIIFDNFAPQIFRFFLVRTSNRETAEDLTQEVFFKVIRRIETFDQKLGSFSGWLWQIARNTVKDYYRKKKPLPLSDYVLQKKERDDFISYANDTNQDLKMSEALDLIKNFSEEEQEVFSLHYLSDLPYKEIGKRFSKSENSLRVLVHRVNKKIRKLINND